MKNGVVKKVYSGILDKQVDIWVLCPEQPKALLYMMHGNGGDCLEWAENTDLVEQAQKYGLAVVAPDFEDSYCTDTADGRPWFRYLSQELPTLVQELLGHTFAPEKTYIAGISAGAYGLLKLAFAHPGRFAACASLSGVTDMADAVIEVSPEVAALILKAKIALSSDNGEALEAGCLGSMGGCKIYVSPNIVKQDVEGKTYHKCLARTKRAIAFAEQLSEIDAYRPEKRFADAVKGLHLYGAKVVHPAEMVLLDLAVGA